MQNGDVLLFQTTNGGDISITDGVAQMTQGLETAVYISLFSPECWFLNDIAETDAERISSKTNQIISTLSQSSKNYQLLIQAVEADLKWLLDKNLANDISISVAAEKLNRVKITIVIEQDSGSTNLTLPIEWGRND